MPTEESYFMLTLSMAGLTGAVSGKFVSSPLVRKLPWPGPLKYVLLALECAVAEQVCNRLFREQLKDGELDFLEGVELRLHIKDIDFDCRVSKAGNRLRFSKGKGVAETTFSGNSREFLLLAGRREDPDTLFFQRRLSIEGDTEIGLCIKNLIDSIDRDELPAVLNSLLDLGADFAESLPESETGIC